MCTLPEPVTRPLVELADIFRMHGDIYVQDNILTPEQYKVFNAIKNCRTSVLGGHVEQCDRCDAIQCAYNSCRNRHCPKCGAFLRNKVTTDASETIFRQHNWRKITTIRKPKTKNRHKSCKQLNAKQAFSKEDAFS